LLPPAAAAAAVAAAGFLAALPVVAWALWLLLLLSATRGGGGAAARGATGGSRASDQCRGRRNLDLVREAQFLEEELVASVGEGEVVGGDVVGGVGEFLVQSAEQIEDKGRLGDGLVDVAQLVGGGLHAVAVVVDCGVPLSQRMEFMTQEDGPWCLVRLEQGDDGGSQRAGRLGDAIHGHVEDGLRNGSVDPATDAAICLFPGGINGLTGNGGGAVEVPQKTKFPAHVVEVGGPPSEVRVLQLEGDRHVGFDGDRGIGVDEDGAASREARSRGGRADGRRGRRGLG
jgi:hypothetical protein